MSGAVRTVTNIATEPFRAAKSLLSGVVGAVVGDVPQAAPAPSPTNSTDAADQLAEAARKAAQRLAAGTSATLTNSGGLGGLTNVGTTSKVLLGQ